MVVTMSGERLVLIHLSDIHFVNELAGTAYDIDEDLRNELENDVIEQKDRFENIHGILVTGDIAFSGEGGDYQNALDWLGRLCDSLDCPRENVWTTPGNHDVIRGTMSNLEPKTPGMLT